VHGYARRFQNLRQYLKEYIEKNTAYVVQCRLLFYFMCRLMSIFCSDLGAADGVERMIMQRVWELLLWSSRLDRTGQILFTFSGFRTNFHMVDTFFPKQARWFIPSILYANWLMWAEKMFVLKKMFALKKNRLPCSTICFFWQKAFKSEPWFL
jgi:hypothetical protein